MSESGVAAGARINRIDQVNMAYDGLELDQLLMGYALGSGRVIHLLTGEIESSIKNLGQAVGPLATAEGVVYPGVAKVAFDRFHNGMEEAAAVKFGPERPRSIGDAVLIKLGIREPRYRQRYRPMDEGYWNRQFMDDYKKQSFVQLEPGESEQHYAGRYIANSIHGLQWANFSYIVYG